MNIDYRVWNMDALMAKKKQEERKKKQEQCDEECGMWCRFLLEKSRDNRPYFVFPENLGSRLYK
jgi:hypothetical protein